MSQPAKCQMSLPLISPNKDHHFFLMKVMLSNFLCTHLYTCQGWWGAMQWKRLLSLNAIRGSHKLIGSRDSCNNHFVTIASLLDWLYGSNSKRTTLQDSYLLVNVFLRAGANDFSKLQVWERYAPLPKRFLKRTGNVLWKKNKRTGAEV